MTLSPGHTVDASFASVKGKLSNLGLGTRGWGYRKSFVDAGALVHDALDVGIRVFDTAPDYGFGTAETLLGAALEKAVCEGNLDRGSLCLITKVGRVPLDPAAPGRKHRQARRLSPEFGPVADNRLLPGRRNFERNWIRESLKRSLANLATPSVDLLLLQEPEWLRTCGRKWKALLAHAFEVLEEIRSEGFVKHWGISSLVGLLSEPSHPLHLDIEEIMQLAVDTCGIGNGLKVLQIRINVETMAALVSPRQVIAGIPFTALEAAGDLGLTVIAVSPFAGGRLINELPTGTITENGQRFSVPQYLLHMASAFPQVSCSIFCSSRPEHVRELAVTSAMPRWGLDHLTGVLA